MIKEYSKKSKKLSWKFKILLVLFIAISIISFTRGFHDLRPVYFGKFIAIGAIIALSVLVVVARGKLIITEETKKICLFFWAWMFFMAISLFGAPYPVSGGVLVVSYILFFLLAFILLPNYIGRGNSLEFKKIFLWSILITTGIIVLNGLSDPDGWYVIWDRVRYQSSFIKPNFFGAFCFLGALISLEIFTLKYSKKYILFTLPCLYMIYISDARAAFLGLMIFIVVLFGLLTYAKIKEVAEKHILKILVFSVIFFVIGAVAFFFADQWDNFYDTSQTINQIFSRRPFYWVQELDNLSVHEWIFGQGIGIEGFGARTIDNFYLDTLIQSGILALLALLAFIFAVYRALEKKLKTANNDYSRRMAAVNLAMFVSLAIYSLSESILFSLGHLVSVYIWISIGLFLNADRGDDNNLVYGRNLIQDRAIL